MLTQIATSTGELTIGGDAFHGQHFAGRIDEVRIYNTALSATQIQTDMNTPIGASGPPDTTAPTDPTGLTATAVSQSQVNLAWTGSTDNVAVANYRVERCQGAACSNFVQVATPTGTTLNDTGLSAATTYRYRVRAADAAGNFSGYTAIQNATTPDTQAPTDPTGLSATAVSASQINLSWTGVDRQRRGGELPGRALPGRDLHDLRPDSRPRPAPPTTTPDSRPQRRIATAYEPPMRPATSAATRRSRTRRRRTPRRPPTRRA